MQGTQAGDFLNLGSYSYPANSNNGLVGGKQKEWIENLEKISQNVDHLYPRLGEDAVKLAYELEKLNRSDCPIVLDPKTASFMDVAIHALKRQRFSGTTVDKHLRYARYMEKHPCPVDFRNPSIENFIKHMDFREDIESASPHALKHEWCAMRMFLKAYGIQIWNYKLPTAPKSHKRILPFPDVVYKFFHYPYSGDNYETALYQYLFCHSFLIGWRVPSEICELKTGDVIINDNGTGLIIITETKKHKSQRTLFPGKQILCSKTHKSFKNWLEKWRPKVENQYSGDALYLQPDGKPLAVRALGHKLSKYGKQVWPSFHPYDTRHWCAIGKLIEQKVNTGTFDVYPVKTWLGHENIQTTMNYIQYAEQYYNQAPYDWFKRVLKFNNYNGIIIGEENTLEPRRGLKVVKVGPKQPPKTLVSTGNSPRELSGPVRI